MDMELSAFVVLVALFIEDGYVCIYNYIYVNICIYIFFFHTCMYILHTIKKPDTQYIFHQE